MDHKTWLWRKKPSEKTIIASDKLTPSLIGNKDGETLVPQTPGTDKEIEWESSVKNLNDKLSSALFESNAKDDLVIKHAKVAEEALAGWEKADSEVASLKLQLEEMILQRLAAEEKINHLDASLKECTQQLHFVREEQGLRINDAITKASKEHEKAKLVFEEKLAETGKKLVKLGVENTHLSKALQEKEKLIEDLSARASQAEIDFNALTARLDTAEKDNTSLKYELLVHEKELEVRSEEREFNRQSADASHKQHLESVKKIAKLESECQRLRLLVRKRLPGPAALAKMKNEVEILGRESNEIRRTKLHPPVGALTVNDSMQDKHHHDSPSKRVNYLLERLCDVEEENKNLKETLAKKVDELESSKTRYAHTAAKLSEAEAQLSELSRSQKNMVLYDEGNSTSHQKEHNEESEKWASALISQLEHFRTDKPRGTLSCNVGGSDMSLMDDFVEMEKLAIVCVDNEGPNNYRSKTFSGSLQTDPAASSSEVTGKELVPVYDGHSGLSDLQTRNSSAGKYPCWIQDILKIILEQNRITLKSSDEIMEEIRAALTQMFGPIDVLSSAKKPSLSAKSNVQRISGYISCGPSDLSPADSNKSASESNTYPEEVNAVRLQSSLRESISKIIKLIEGANQSPLSCNGQQMSLEIHGSSLPETISEMPLGHTVRVFQWISSELNSVLQQLVRTCTDLLNGKADFEKFVQELATAFDWIMNHCFKLDASSAKDATKKLFDCDKSRVESERDIGMHASSQMEAIQTTQYDENMKLKDELMKVKSAKKDLEGDLQSAVVRIDALMNQLQESGRSIGKLQSELETLKELNQMTEDQIETQKLLTEGLNTQLTVARVELNEARQKFSSLEVELEEKANSCQDLEATCLELQLQLERYLQATFKTNVQVLPSLRNSNLTFVNSVTKKDPPQCNGEQEGRQHKPDWEIAAASEKLAECQETILNLGKQLKALASPREAALLDKVISVTPSSETTPSNKKLRSNGSSLLDQMLADSAVAEDLTSPKMKEIICTTDSHKPSTLSSHKPCDAPVVNTFNATAKYLDAINSPRLPKYRSESVSVGTLAIVPSKRRGLEVVCLGSCC
ncbi:hypothetical protein Sjap_022480 [Stephania japonica]|uniref:Filament-like plant protein 7 n=1 Tax=Stephania japonica TaxID=461633 RepID=A0AAP0EW84_9MAGN